MEKDESLGGFLRFFRHMTSDDVVKNEAASLLRQAYIEPGQKRKDREMQCSAWDMFQGQEEDPSMQQCDGAFLLYQVGENHNEIKI